MTLHPVLTLGLGLALVAGGVAMTGRLAVADDKTPGPPAGTPSQARVHAAQQAVRGATDDVASVRAALVVADQTLESAQVDAARAGEAFNGARYRAALARDAARAADRRAKRAAGDVGRQRQVYADAVSDSIQLAPELTTLAAVTRADGIDRVVDQLTTLRTTTEALDTRYDSYRASGIVADVARQDADRARTAATQAQAAARAARDVASDAAAGAAAEAVSVATERDRLIGRLATLQHVSVTVARQRQHGLEVQAAEVARQAAEKAARAAAAKAARKAAERAKQEAAEQAAAQAAQQAAAQESAQAVASASTAASASAEPSSDPTGSPTADPTADPTDGSTADPTDGSTADPTGSPTADPTDSPTEAAPTPDSGAAAAIAFARAQIGEPYVYGAAGPGSWDCSGLTMGAWDAGGISLPHYSVAQYEESTPISRDELQPGDLVFWGSSSSPGSIYHVALYSGGGMIIQAPRTGETVRENSMYDWITPNFFARP